MKTKNYKIPKCMLVVFLISIILISFQLSAQDFDEYGGALAKHFDDGEGKGFFRAKYDGEQWWLVTPEDNAFLSYGLNHFHANLWNQDWSEGHWVEEFGGARHTDIWKNNFHKHAKEISALVNANTLGYHNEEPILLERERFLPYIAQYIPLQLSMHTNPTAEDFVDVFSDAFTKLCEDKAQEQVAPYVNDPMILGFSMSDIPTLTEFNAKSVQSFKGYNISTFARVLRNLPATAPGKKKYVETMEKHYDYNLQNFNKTYNTTFSSWDDLKNAENWRPLPDLDNDTELNDNNEFNKLCINRYYKIASEAFRAVDSNHMFIGDKLNANLFTPEELPLIVNEIKDYVDVVMIQCFADTGYQGRVHDRITAAANLPIINGDGGYGAHGDPRMPSPQRPIADNQTHRAELIKEYVETSFSNKSYVGFYMCGVIDSYNVGGTQKPGIMNPFGQFHTQVVNALADIGNNLYAYRGLNTDMTEYTLTVNNGIGDGFYRAGTTVNISADAPPSGQIFDQWTGDITNVANVFQANTTIASPSGNANITASYIDENTDNNLIKNGYFEEDFASWNFWNAADASADVINEELVISITASDATWKPGLQQGEIALTSGKEYMLSFDAKATDERTLEMRFQYADNAFALNELSDLTTSMQNFTFNFTANQDDTGAKLKFNCGGSTHSITLDNIILREVPAATTYNLSVIGGTGSGDYILGSTVTITAEDAPTNQIFDKWTGDTDNITDVNNPNTKIRLLFGETTTVTATYTGTLSVNSIDKSKLYFYPNPTSNTINFKEESDYEIYTILGKKIMGGKRAIIVDVSNLSDGLYFLKAQNKLNKLIIQK